MVGCSKKNEASDPGVENDLSVVDTIIDEETKEEQPSIEDLRELLGKSSIIEVKDIDNQIIGKINSIEKINKAVEDIFLLDITDEYTYTSTGNIVGTINFYIQGSEPIYGLIKDKFVYIEGYYFVSKNNNVEKIVSFFENNTEEEPIVED